MNKEYLRVRQNKQLFKEKYKSSELPEAQWGQVFNNTEISPNALTSQPPRLRDSIPNLKFYNSFSLIYCQNAQVNVQFYVRLFEIRKILLTAWVLVKVLRFTIENTSYKTTLGPS